MKIILPTDFSKVANYALDAASLFVKKFGGDIQLVHFVEYPKSLELVEIETFLKKEVRDAFISRARSNCQKLQDDFTQKGIKLDYSVKEGDMIAGLASMLESYNPDLLVIGSHGASGKTEWFIGSNTQKVVRKLRIPILVVKNPLENLNFESAVYVSGLFENEKEAFKKFLSISKQLGIHTLHIMTVDTSSYFTQPTILIKEVLEDFRVIAEGMNVETHFYKDLSVDAGVRHFVAEHNVDLIAISNHQRHPVKRIFSGSNVEMIVNHSDRPVLTIDY